jgi:hypothetical protein
MTNETLFIGIARQGSSKADARKVAEAIHETYPNWLSCAPKSSPGGAGDFWLELSVCCDDLREAQQVFGRSVVRFLRDRGWRITLTR